MREMVKSRLFSLLLILCIFALGASLGRTVDWQYINEAATKLQGLTIGGTNSGDPATIDGTQTLTNKTISGGTLSGSITNNATINGGTYASPTITTPTVNGSQLDATGGQINVTQYLVSTIHRSQFVYNGDSTAYTIKLGGGVYIVKDKIARWNSELTTTAISSPAADTRYYLYLDYDSITSETLITNTNLLWSTTAPSPSDQYKGFYNGDDLCIFCVITNATPDNILIFHHDGGQYVSWDYAFSPDPFTTEDTWTDFDASAYMPAFSSQIQCSICLGGSSVSTKEASARWRINGSSDTYGHYAGRANGADSPWGYQKSIMTQEVMTDSSNIFEWKIGIILGSGGTMYIYFYIHGWYLPQGM